MSTFRQQHSDCIRAAWRLVVVCFALLIASGAGHGLRAQLLTPDQWRTVDNSCPNGDALQIRPAARLNDDRRVEAWRVELRVPESSSCSPLRPKHVRLVVDGVRVLNPFEQMEHRDAPTVGVSLPDSTARTLGNAGSARVIVRGVLSTLPQNFGADTQRLVQSAGAATPDLESEKPAISKQSREPSLDETDPSTDTRDDESNPSTSTSNEDEDERENDQVYMIVEESPSIVGGMERVREAIEYPEKAKKKGTEGRVLVQFVVDQQGQATNVEVLRGINTSLNQEARRVIRSLDFTPGKQRGEPVKVQMSLPVTFRLPEGQES